MGRGKICFDKLQLNWQLCDHFVNQLQKLYLPHSPVGIHWHCKTPPADLEVSIQVALTSNPTDMAMENERNDKKKG